MDPFHPTWPRFLLALGMTTLGFLLPQKIPLEYYSLNNPSSGLQYLEITCAANTTDLVKVSLDTGRHFNDFETIRWPISPSDVVYTYTFPLPDAPIRKLRLAPFETKPGELTITNFRIINRRGQEIRRFTKDDFQRSYQIAGVVPVAGGWKIVTNLNATNPFSDIKLLSLTYLSLMIWILLLAVRFALKMGQPVSAFRFSHSAFQSILFAALIAVLFSAVGNRGLIKNSIHYAFYTPPVHV